MIGGLRLLLRHLEIIIQVGVPVHLVVVRGVVHSSPFQPLS